MARIVMKFGGTSMAGIERIRSVAARIKREAAAGNEVAVVVSAMAGETDRLVGFCREASPLYDAREYDVVVSAGEQVTSGLLAIALQAMGVPARSWLGWQLPIRTSDAFARARIGEIDTAALDASLAAGEVAVIPGFQGAGPTGTGASPRSAAAAPTRRRWRWRRRCRRGSLRHLHRRRRRLHHRPAHRAARAQAPARHLRGDARARQRRRQGAPDPLGRAGDEGEGPRPGAVVVRRRRCADGGHAARHDDRRRRGDRRWNASSSPASRTTRTRRRSR